MVVKIETHNPTWPTEFLQAKSELQEILSEAQILSMEHVGRTSIPGLVAKPVLDIDIIVIPEAMAATRAALAAAGYQDRGELGVPGRVVFRQPEISRKNRMARNTYVVLQDCLSLRNHLDLRRVLLEDGELKEEYGNVKKMLILRGVVDVDEYCRGKNEIMVKILRKAGWNEEELREVRRVNE